MSNLDTLFTARAEKLVFYAPYHFIRNIEKAKQLQAFVYQPLHQFGQNLHQQIITVTAESEVHLFYVTYLPWDSDFFQRTVYKLFTVLYSHQNYRILKQAVSGFIEQLVKVPDQYCFIEIPTEDILLIQALHANGFITVETRLAFFRAAANYYQERYAVKKATAADVNLIRKVAANMRNPYDRFHAEPAFSSALADAFIGKYAQEAVNGYCDVVLIPDEGEVSAEAFLALNYSPDDFHQIDCKITKIVLTAVAPACKGWHYKLMSEAIYQAKAQEENYIWFTTQITNAAVIRNSEKLGFSLGGAKHILSYTRAL